MTPVAHAVVPRTAAIAADHRAPVGPGVASAFPALPLELPEAGAGSLVAADIGRLLRPRITVMVLATVTAAAWLTAGRGVDLRELVALLVGTALVAASSSIANQVLERRTDRLMPRTANRPVSAGRIDPVHGWWIAAGLGGAGLVLVVAGGGIGAALAAALTWLLYVVVYTPLKRLSPLNTAVGAVPGALPVAIGWLGADGPARLAAGDHAGAVAVAALGAVLYLWQFPHFMAIAWLYRRQYAAAGLKMLTVVDPTGIRAGAQAVATALVMVPASLLLAVPSGRWPLFCLAAALSGTYVAAAARFAFARDDRSARRLLLVSIVVLLGLLLAAVGCGPPRA